MYGPRKKKAMITSQNKLMRETGLDHPPTVDEYLDLVQSEPECSNHPLVNTQARFFCGFEPECENICSPKARQIAKRNFWERYKVVGITEHYRLSLQLLEAKLPMFRQATAVYDDILKKAGKEKVTNKDPRAAPPSERAKELLRIQHEADIDLYNTALKRFMDDGDACGLDTSQVQLSLQ